jgi:ribosomal-protein-alanine N-acetyltransferase
MSGALKLKRLSTSDTQDLFTLWSDAETVKLTNWSLLTTIECCVTRVEKILVRYGAGSRRCGPMVIRDEQGEFVGLIGADVEEPFKNEHEIWYLLKRDQWGKGFGTFSVAAFLDQLRLVPAIGKVVATAVSVNIASWRILEINGFRRTSTVVGGITRNDLPLDIFHYEQQLGVRT